MPRQYQWRRQCQRWPNAQRSRANSLADTSVNGESEAEARDTPEDPVERVSDHSIVLALSKMSGACAMSLRIRTCDTVSQVKQIIAREEGTPAWQQRLVLGSTILQDFQTISTYGPFEEDRALVTLIHDSLLLPIRAREH